MPARSLGATTTGTRASAKAICASADGRFAGASDGRPMNQPWLQNFDPLGSPLLSTLAAAAPVCALFYFLAVRRTPAWRAAVYAFGIALLIALAVFRMPAVMVAGAVADGMVFGWFRIAWMVVAAVFVYDISVESGQFEIIKRSVGEISSDRRLQVLLVAFAFGALLEGAGGGGAPVAVTAAMMAKTLNCGRIPRRDMCRLWRRSGVEQAVA